MGKIFMEQASENGGRLRLLKPKETDPNTVRTEGIFYCPAHRPGFCHLSQSDRAMSGDVTTSREAIPGTSNVCYRWKSVVNTTEGKHVL